MSEAFDLHWDRGWEFYEAEKFEEAITAWRAAADLDPEDGYVLNNIGRALSKLGQQEAALAEWQEAVRLEPDYDSPHTNLAYFLSAKGYSPEALAAVRAAIRLKSDDVYLYDYLGFHLLVQADENKDRAGWKAAAAAFQQAISIDPANSYAHRHLARTQWCLKQKREAIKILKAAIAADPNDAEAYVQLWNYQSRARDFQGMAQTTYAMDKLPDSEALNQHDTELNDLWVRFRLNSLLGIGAIGVMAGSWFWYRRRG